LAEAEAGHSLYHADLGTRVRVLLEGEGQQVWIDRVEAEHDNLRSVVRRAIDKNNPEAALLAIGTMWRYFHRRGHLTEAREWLDTLLAMPGGSARARAEATDAMAAMRYWQNDMEESMRLYKESLALFEMLGDREHMGDALFSISAAANFLGDFELGREYGDRALAVFEAAGLFVSVRKVHASEAFRIWLGGDLEN
jgi:tetratricopeptide (TPR) repeat protein